MEHGNPKMISGVDGGLNIVLAKITGENFLDVMLLIFFKLMWDDLQYKTPITQINQTAGTS